MGTAKENLIVVLPFPNNKYFMGHSCNQQRASIVKTQRFIKRKSN